MLWSFTSTVWIFYVFYVIFLYVLTENFAMFSLTIVTSQRQTRLKVAILPQDTQMFGENTQTGDFELHLVLDEKPRCQNEKILSNNMAECSSRKLINRVIWLFAELLDFFSASGIGIINM